MKLSLGQHDPSRIRSESAIGSADSDQSVDDFHNFFSQIDTECDVDRSAGRRFNLSALYALLMLVLVVEIGTDPKRFPEPKGIVLILSVVPMQQVFTITHSYSRKLSTK